MTSIVVINYIYCIFKNRNCIYIHSCLDVMHHAHAHDINHTHTHDTCIIHLGDCIHLPCTIYMHIHTLRSMHMHISLVLVMQTLVTCHSPYTYTYSRCIQHSAVQCSAVQCSADDTHHKHIIAPCTCCVPYTCTMHIHIIHTSTCTYTCYAAHSIHLSYIIYRRSE